ncbi:hypothetical protein SOCE26_073650 [Sorangium cellulosum]|uniref:Uncharacterized protein n=1 Tax=Sorangium cellulosum TaxID=56 RepID=A0A2L0F336_SORCE|nr:hypothetical protein SOCE26_073650 [Sorangium cellulosum]
MVLELLLDEEEELLLDEEEEPVIVPPLPVTDAIEGRPLPFAQNPHCVEVFLATAPLWPTFVALSCPPDGVMFAFHELLNVEPLSATTTFQPVVARSRRRFFTVTFAQ